MQHWHKLYEFLHRTLYVKNTNKQVTMDTKRIQQDARIQHTIWIYLKCFCASFLHHQKFIAKCKWVVAKDQVIQFLCLTCSKFSLFFFFFDLCLNNMCCSVCLCMDPDGLSTNSDGWPCQDLVAFGEPHRWQTFMWNCFMNLMQKMTCLILHITALGHSIPIRAHFNEYTRLFDYDHFIGLQLVLCFNVSASSGLWHCEIKIIQVHLIYQETESLWHFKTAEEKSISNQYSEWVRSVIQMGSI